MIVSDYYIWLLSKVDLAHGTRGNFNSLMSFLFSTEYEYAFEMDSNRAKAGEGLRSIYALEAGLYLEDVHNGPCSVLEMLIALADNLAFNTDSLTSYWFWLFLSNLGIATHDDEHYDQNYIQNKLSVWMNHEYAVDGRGSLFPLKNPHSDCRNMEVWDQMNAYLVENYPVGNWID